MEGGHSLPCRMRGQKCRRETDTAKATQTGKHKSCLLPLNKTLSQHHCPGQADLLGQSPEQSCSRAMMLPTISSPSQISGEPGSCPATRRTVIFCCYPFNSQTKETLATLSQTAGNTERLITYFCYLCLLAQRKIIGSSPANPYPLALLESWALGLKDLEEG